MLRNRSASGDLVPDPARFPAGWPAVTAFIHGLGMKAGLYTSKSPFTCAGFAASCEHEARDAALFAQWEIDYVKEDSCGPCRNNDTADYVAMHDAIVAAGRPMVQTDEGAPDDAACSATNACGNGKRVGHDIQPVFTNMMSLVDIGSGLFSFAHNSSGSGGWFNDLDMLEIGNGDFACSADDAAAARCRVHMSMWAIMKAPLLIGTNVTAMLPSTLAVLTNAAAIAINQDPLGVQARRVAVAAPANATLSPPFDSLAVVARCDAARATQQWTWTNSTPAGGAPTSLFEVKCAAGDAAQQWDFLPDGTLRNRGAGLCVDAPTAGCSTSSAQLAPCDAARAQQQWALLPGGQIRQRAAGASCLDVPYGVGPAVAYCACHPPGTATNQEWALDAAGALASAGLAGTCLGALPGLPGGLLSTAGGALCLGAGDEEGSWHGVPCDARGGGGGAPILLSPVPARGGAAPPAGVRGNFTFSTPSRSAPAWKESATASGPWPATQYVVGGSATWELALGAPGPVVAVDGGGIWLNDFVSPPARGAGGPWCLDVVAGGALETWAAPLAGGRVAVALLNRSPGADTITMQWADVGLPAGAQARVTDAWTGDQGIHMDSFAAQVGARDVMLLTVELV